jgi:hypothetical protein
MDDTERSRRLNQIQREYGSVFKDEESLHAYWTRQAHSAAMCGGASDPRAHAGAGGTQFRLSCERSTAGWAVTLDGDAVNDSD